LYWSIRRELWENRSIYIAPVAAAVLFLFGFAISIIRMRLHKEVLWSIDQFELAPALIMGAALIVSIFYCLDALYGERRDRSILFWKSLPVSDVTAVISKLCIPILVLPLLSFVITVATQLLTLVMSSAVFAGSGVNLRELWTHVSLFRVPGIWLPPCDGPWSLVRAALCMVAAGLRMGAACARLMGVSTAICNLRSREDRIQHFLFPQPAAVPLGGAWERHGG